MDEPPRDASPDQPPPGAFRFSLRTLLIVMTVCAVLVGLLGNRIFTLLAVLVLAPIYVMAFVCLVPAWGQRQWAGIAFSLWLLLSALFLTYCFLAEAQFD